MFVWPGLGPAVAPEVHRKAVRILLQMGGLRPPPLTPALL